MQDTSKPDRNPWHFQWWAAEQRVGNGTRKLILLTLAVAVDFRTGVGFQPQAELAVIAECSERSVRAHLTALEDAGFIARRAQYKVGGGRTVDLFALLDGTVTEWLDGSPIEGIPAKSAGGHTGKNGVPNRQELLPQYVPSSTALGGREARERDVREGRPLKVKHNRTTVPDALTRRALFALNHFNVTSGENIQAWKPDGKPTPELIRVLGAIKDHPELSREEWAAVVDGVLSDPNPWWGGKPGVGVVFGPKVVGDNIRDPRRWERGGVGNGANGAAPPRNETAAERQRREKNERNRRRLQAAGQGELG